MAIITTAHPISEIHGAFRKGEKVVFRMRDGVQQAYVVKHPYKGKPSEAQAQQRSKFQLCTQQIKAIYADPAQRQQWQDRFDAYTSSPAYRKQMERYLRQSREPQHIPAVPLPQSLRTRKPPTTLYGFILSSLTHNS